MPQYYPQLPDNQKTLAGLMNGLQDYYRVQSQMLQMRLAQERALRAAQGGRGGGTRGAEKKAEAEIAPDAPVNPVTGLPDGAGPGAWVNLKDPTVPEGSRRVWLPGKTKGERESYLPSYQEQVAKTLVQNDPALQDKIAKFPTMDVRAQEELLSEIRNQDVKRLNDLMGGTGAGDVLKGITSQLEESVKAKKQAIDRDDGWKAVGDNLTIFGKKVDAFIDMLGESPAEQRVIGARLNDEIKKIQENNAYLHDQQLRESRPEDERESWYSRFFTSPEGTLANAVSFGTETVLPFASIIGASALGSLAAGPPGGIAAGMAAGGLVGAVNEGGNFVQRVTGDPNLTPEEQVKAIEEGRGTAMAVGAGINAAYPLSPFRIGGKILGSKAAGKVLPNAVTRRMQPSGAVGLSYRQTAKQQGQAAYDAAIAGGADIAAANAARRAATRNALKEYAERRTLGNTARDLAQNMTDATSITIGNVMAQNKIYADATGQDIPLTEGLGDAASASLLMGGIFGGVQARMRKNIRGEKPDPTKPATDPNAKEPTDTPAPPEDPPSMQEVSDIFGQLIDAEVAAGKNLKDVAQRYYDELIEMGGTDDQWNQFVASRTGPNEQFLLGQVTRQRDPNSTPQAVNGSAGGIIYDDVSSTAVRKLSGILSRLDPNGAHAEADVLREVRKAVAEGATVDDLNMLAAQGKLSDAELFSLPRRLRNQNGLSDKGILLLQKATETIRKEQANAAQNQEGANPGASPRAGQAAPVGTNGAGGEGSADGPNPPASGGVANAAEGTSGAAPGGGSAAAQESGGADASGGDVVTGIPQQRTASQAQANDAGQGNASGQGTAGESVGQSSVPTNAAGNQGQRGVGGAAAGAGDAQGQPAQGSVGNGSNARRVSLRIGDEKLPVVYRVVDADNLNASADADLNPNPNYTKYRNSWRYEKDSQERSNVIDMSARFDPELVLNSSNGSSALEGEPVIDRQGNQVIAGNSRTIAMQRVYKGGSEAAKQRLRSATLKKARELGIPEEELAGIANPVLVRELEFDVSPEAGQRMIDTTNAPVSKSMTLDMQANASKGLVEGEPMKVFAREIVDSSGEIKYETLNAYLTSPASKPLVESLRRSGVITPENATILLRGDMLSKDGRELVARILRNRILPDADAVDFIDAYPSIGNKIDRMAMAAATLDANYSPELSLTGVIREAIALARLLKTPAYDVPFGNARLFDEAVRMRQDVNGRTLYDLTPDKRVISMARHLYNARQKEMAQMMGKYLRAASRGRKQDTGSLVPVKKPDPMQTFSKIFDPDTARVEAIAKMGMRELDKLVAKRILFNAMQDRMMEFMPELTAEQQVARLENMTAETLSQLDFAYGVKLTPDDIANIETLNVAYAPELDAAAVLDVADAAVNQGLDPVAAIEYTGNMRDTMTKVVESIRNC